MKTELRRFEGTVVNAAAVKITGATDGRVGTLASGEEVYFVGKGVVTAITHKDQSGEFVRIHTVKASVIILIDADHGKRFVEESELLADERFGIQHLFDSLPGAEE